MDIVAEFVAFLGLVGVQDNVRVAREKGSIFFGFGKKRKVKIFFNTGKLLLFFSLYFLFHYLILTFFGPIFYVEFFNSPNLQSSILFYFYFYFYFLEGKGEGEGEES